MAKYRHSKGPSVLQVFIIVLVVILSIAVIGGAAFAVYHFAIDKNEPEPTEPSLETLPPATVEEVATEPPTEDVNAQYTSLAQDYMADMSLEEKIYQMMIVTPEELTDVDVATVAGDMTKEAIKSYPVGGIYYSAQNFEDEEQTTEMIKNSQSYAKTPMFIAVTEEGGEKSPVLSKLSSQQFDESVYAKSGDQVVQDYAGVISNSIASYGFNLNLAPCANNEGDNAFAGDTKGDLLCSAFNGFNSNGVISALKFFPVLSDSDKLTDELRETEFVPFAAAIDAGADVIMVGDAKVSGIDPDNPAYLSERIVTEILIKELKYNGVVMSPDLTEKDDDTIVSALNSGINLLLCPDDIDDYVETIKQAISSGALTQDKIDLSVTKILALKYKYGIIPAPVTPTPSEITSESTEIVFATE